MEILQVRILEWVAVPSSRESSQLGSPALQVDSLPSEPPGKPKNTGVGSLFLLQGNFPAQESNRGLLHRRWILYQLSYSGSPKFKTPSFIFQDKFFRNREKRLPVFNVGFHPVLVIPLCPLTAPSLS